MILTALKWIPPIDYFLLDIIMAPWEPFKDEETNFGFLTGLRVADYIENKYRQINNTYKTIFVTAALGVGGEVVNAINEYIEERKQYCTIVRKPILDDSLIINIM